MSFFFGGIQRFAGKFNFQSLRNAGKAFFNLFRKPNKQFPAAKQRRGIIGRTEGPKPIKTRLTTIKAPVATERIATAQSKVIKDFARKQRKARSIARGKQTTAFKEAQKRIKTRIISL